MQERPSRQDPGTNAEDSDYGRAWGTARQPQMMLSVRFANGNRRFFAYTDLAGGDYLGNVIRLYFLKGARNPRLISDPVKKQSVASVT
jgi:hypothetical protein